MLINKEKFITALYLFFALSLAFIAGVGRKVSAYSDIAQGTIRFTCALATLVFGVVVMFLALKYPPKRFWIYSGAICAAIIFLFLPPMASGDVLTSLLRIKIFATTHLNPYLVAPSQFPGDSWYAGTSWQHIPMPYGPLWVFFSIIFVPLKGASLAIALFFYKLVLSALAIGSGYLAGKVAEEIGVDSIRTEISFLWNPLVVLTVYSDAHNDILMIILFLLALLLLVRRHFTLSMLALMGSALTKYASALALPFFVLHIIREEKKPTEVARALLPALLLPIILFFPFWKGTETFRGALLASSLVSANSFIVHTFSFFGAKFNFFTAAKVWIAALLLSGAAVTLLWSSGKEGRIIKGMAMALGLLVLSLTDLFNWYLLWPLSALILIEEKRWRWALIYISAFGILHLDWKFWKSALVAAIFCGLLFAAERWGRELYRLSRSKIFGKV